VGASQTAYEALLARVEKPGRCLGNERGTVLKDPGGVQLRFALAFPDVYEIGQSHPGLQILYDLLNRRADVHAERVYAPWFDMEAALRDAGLPLPTLETFTPLRCFDVVGFTLQHELTYTNSATAACGALRRNSRSVRKMKGIHPAESFIPRCRRCDTKNPDKQKIPAANALGTRGRDHSRARRKQPSPAMNSGSSCAYATATYGGRRPNSSQLNG